MLPCRFGQLQQVNVSGVQPALSGAQQDGGSMLREDAPQAYAARAELLAQAPQLEGSFIRVPTTAGAAMADGEAAAAVAKAAAGTASASSTPAAAAPAADAAGSDKAAGDAPAPAGPDMEALHALDMRVGTIIKVEPHPDADTLYVEQVDCGEAEPRTIVSGLRKFVAAEALLGSSVIVLANLKPRNMRGIKSAGMLLCASSAAHDVVEPLAPPQGSAPGSRCYFGDSGEAQPAPAEPNRVDKKKYWDKVAPGLKTDGSGVATYCGMVMKVQAGPVKAATLKDARIA